MLPAADQRGGSVSGRALVGAGSIDFRFGLGKAMRSRAFAAACRRPYTGTALPTAGYRA